MNRVCSWSILLSPPSGTLALCVEELLASHPVRATGVTTASNQSIRREPEVLIRVKPDKLANNRLTCD